jgi:hypothetical protein
VALGVSVGVGLSHGVGVWLGVSVGGNHWVGVAGSVRVGSCTPGEGELTNVGVGVRDGVGVGTRAAGLVTSIRMPMQ